MSENEKTGMICLDCGASSDQVVAGEHKGLSNEYLNAEFIEYHCQACGSTFWVSSKISGVEVDPPETLSK